MASGRSDATRIKERGWRQGSILPASLVSRLRGHGLPAEHNPGSELFIVVSHDCDVTNTDLNAEPYVEVARARIIRKEEIDGNFLWGKNPRIYQFSGQRGQEIHCELSIHDIVSLPREHLQDFDPDGHRQLAPEIRRSICRWIAGRYSRQSFPDAFNERVRPVVTQLRREFKKQGHLLSGIYLVVSDDELDAGEVYKVIVWATMPDEEYEIRDQRALAQQLVDKIEAAFTSCDGVEVGAVELRSEADVSLSDLRKLKRWEFDDLTLRGEPDSALPPSD